MDRKPRVYIPGVAHHIVQRGNNRQACFGDESDYKVYLTYLKEGAEQNNVAIHPFVLMTNNVHILCTPKDEKGNSRLLQTLGRRYVQYFNHKYGRTGTL
ncbi:transposase [Reinekea blandensis]|uniref:Transposase and inactivated derivatives n=1 Tax=Reinekea blandensis MED297 TaxID=314283 RepID=A4B8V8_9GAMM|nr:transposase [Reinekea blandensis]EAR11059.1 Transposase and inactivated derivatives [Reinekea sp. MED297] [Reinekea blandensis MED297]